MGIKYVFNPFTNKLDAIDDSTFWSRTGTVLSPKTAGDDIEVNGVTILDVAPILVFQDSNGAGAASTGFIEWRDSGGGRAGYFGNASSGDDDLSWGNEQGGHIKIVTTGAGELQVSAPLNMNTNKIVGVVDPTTDQEAATKKYHDDHDTGDTTAHASFSQLDFASAAHTGFAPALGADDNYVTDAEKIVIGNTSNTNTGDQNSHDALDDVSANDHHAQTHTIVSHDTTATGAELTTVADGVAAKNAHTHTHASTTGRTVNDHHAQSHNIASHNDTTGTGAELNTLTDGSDTTLHVHTTLQPTGAIIMYGAAAAPTGWVNCDGASLLRAGTYAALFAVIGVVYGTADGSHFNVPDMRGAFPRGAGTSTQFTQDHATTLGTYEDDSMQGHWHTILLNTAGSEPDKVIFSTTNNASPSFGTVIGDPFTDRTNGTPRTANETRPNNLGVNFIIKY